ncbi:YlbF family regulator [Desulforamulus hydrothermalis]|uniref:YlbF family regulator n=1 Tax=Desulforamulus hydrothermalis TaxID=412895 RepID=UPI003B75BCF0
MKPLAKIDTALELCVQLGKILSETEEYQKMKQAEANLLHNEEARRLVEGLQQLQMDIQKKKLAGIPLSEVDKNNMKEAEARALENPIVKASFEAHEQFQAIMTLVSTKIREGIRGTELTPPDDDEEISE